MSQPGREGKKDFREIVFYPLFQEMGVKNNEFYTVDRMRNQISFLFSVIREEGWGIDFLLGFLDNVQNIENWS
ncbi:MAG: hypothetical protein A2V86_06585 [Deltaproteobacteria bacterium RBG_16_49_23]|nr:MAG: hypothetical protein A2V86_06585 [Deltaproteobacteria bacterium RBG_16_49_23]